MDDIQLKSLLTSAISFRTLCEQPLIRKVLEIDLHATSARYHTLLLRVIRSIEQYLNKQKDLRYIGLVGHYSSGKSSTINALLDLDGTDKERETGLNPTDKVITLLTHPANSGSLILMNKEGVAVPIRSEFIDHHELKGLVLADTPGSGDPDVINELVQDFLPVCDILFYFIAASNPIDQADLPLLEQKDTSLPFIPLVFVVTRADEFRRDRTTPFSSENIDEARVKDFLGKLIARLRNSIRSEEIVSEHFLFIDNLVGYNIDTLRKKMFTAAASMDSAMFVKIHSHKVAFYQRAVNEIFDHFLAMIDEKVSQCAGFVGTAKDNITRFDKSVEINNERLKLLWIKSGSLAKESFTEEKSGIDELSYSPLVGSMGFERNIQSEQRVLNSMIEQLARGQSGRVVGDLNFEMKNKLREMKYNIRDNVEKGVLLKENIIHLFPNRFDYMPSYEKTEIDFSRLNEPVNALLEKLTATSHDSRNSLKWKLLQLRSLAEKEVLINSVLEQYSVGRTAIADGFDQYFEKIQMYRTAVLNKNTKETIQSLRLGGELDSLDQEFDPDFMSQMKDEASAFVYSDNAVDVLALRNRVQGLISEAANLRSELEQIPNIKRHDQIVFGKESISMLSFLTGIYERKLEMINLGYQAEISGIIERHRARYKRYLSEIGELKDKRRRFLWGITGIVILLGLLSFVAYRFYGIGSPTTLVGEIFLAIATGLFCQVVAVAIFNVKMNFGRISADFGARFSEESRAEILAALDENFWEVLASKIEGKTAVNVAVLRNVFRGKVDPVVAKRLEICQDQQNKYNEIGKRFDVLLKSYKDALTEFYTVYSAVFADIDGNTLELSKTTRKVKELAIKPSFDLLEETMNNLIGVRSELLRIRSH